MDTNKREEYRIYVIIWGVLFMLVPFNMLIEMLLGHAPSFQWTQVLGLWGRLSPFLVLFLAHDYIARWFKTKSWLYGLLVTLLILVFAWYCLATGQRPPSDLSLVIPPPDGEKPIHPETMKILLGILIIATNLGIKEHFEFRRKEERLQKLESENLRGQLEALRYKINPHFLMNTLNNIQALILTNPDKAMDSISILSKMMRTLLSEGDSPAIPLSAEIDFINEYLTLVRLRYPSDIVIRSSFPDCKGNEVVPPLLMATIIENAFKHGTPGHDGPFIEIVLTVSDGRIHFKCSNHCDESRVRMEQHGMGLSNIKERLELLYGTDFSLQVSERQHRFDVTIDIPSNIHQDWL